MTCEKLWLTGAVKLFDIILLSRMCSDVSTCVYDLTIGHLLLFAELIHRFYYS